MKYHWTTDMRITAAHISDLDGDGRCEFAIGHGVGASMKPSVALYSLTGQMLPGWPKVQGYGLYSDSITSLDLDGDGIPDISVADLDHDGLPDGDHGSIGESLGSLRLFTLRGILAFLALSV